MNQPILKQIFDIQNTDDYKSFKYKSKLLGNTVADRANGILRNAIIVK